MAREEDAARVHRRTMSKQACPHHGVVHLPALPTLPLPALPARRWQVNDVNPDLAAALPAGTA